MTQIGSPDRFCANYSEGKIFTKVGKFQSGIQTCFERKSSSIFSTKASLFVAIIKAAKPGWFCVFYPKGKFFVFVFTNKDKFQSELQTIFERESSSSGL